MPKARTATLAALLLATCGQRDPVLAAEAGATVVGCGAFSVLANSTFSTNLSFWSPAAGTSWSPEDADSSPTSGSVEITVSELTSIAIGQCVPVAGGERYMLDVAVRLETQGQVEGRAGIVARWHADEDCTQEMADPPANTFVTLAPDWTRQSLTPTSPAGARSALIELRATKSGGSGGSTLTANLDNPFFAFLGSRGCGDPVCSYRGPSSSDALFVLRAAVGSLECPACYCDVDDSGEITVGDALTVLRASVDVPVTLACPACG